MISLNYFTNLKNINNNFYIIIALINIVLKPLNLQSIAFKNNIGQIFKLGFGMHALNLNHLTALWTDLC